MVSPQIGGSISSETHSVRAVLRDSVKVNAGKGGAVPPPRRHLGLELKDCPIVNAHKQYQRGAYWRLSPRPRQGARRPGRPILRIASLRSRCLVDFRRDVPPPSPDLLRERIAPQKDRPLNGQVFFYCGNDVDSFVRNSLRSARSWFAAISPRADR
jgi:hypothetical protein